LKLVFFFYGNRLLTFLENKHIPVLVENDELTLADADDLVNPHRHMSTCRLHQFNFSISLFFEVVSRYSTARAVRNNDATGTQLSDTMNEST